MILWSGWIYSEFLFYFIILFRIHFVAWTKGIELCHFPWVFVKVSVTRDCILMTDWCLLSRLLLLSYWFLFSFFIPFFFPYIKHHKLVWYVCRKRNLVRMQYYCSHSSLLIVLMISQIDTSLLKSGHRVELVFLSPSLMLWQKGFHSSSWHPL